MKLLIGDTPDGAREPDEYIKNPNLHLKLNVERSKAYVKAILNDMDAKTALKFLNDQILTKNLLLNDAIIGQLEMLNEPNLSPGARAAIVQSIQALTASSTQITQSKLALDKAIGLELASHLPGKGENPNPQAASREIAADEFAKVYKETTEAPKQNGN